MELTQNDWYQRDIIKKIIIFTKQRSDMIYAVIPTEYQKYPSTTILKHASVLDKLNKLTCVCLLDMPSHDTQYYNALTHNDHLGY